MGLEELAERERNEKKRLCTKRPPGAQQGQGKGEKYKQVGSWFGFKCEAQGSQLHPRCWDWEFLELDYFYSLGCFWLCRTKTLTQTDLNDKSFCFLR